MKPTSLRIIGDPCGRRRQETHSVFGQEVRVSLRRLLQLRLGALLFSLLVLLLCSSAQSQSANSSAGSESELCRKLKALPGVVEVRETTRSNSQSFRESYEVMFEQPLDHQNPNGEKFRQRFFLSHNDY